MIAVSVRVELADRKYRPIGQPGVSFCAIENQTLLPGVFLESPSLAVFGEAARIVRGQRQPARNKRQISALRIDR